MDEDLFAGNARGISKIYHEVINLLKFLQTKPQVKNMNRNFNDLYYTVSEKRDEKKLQIIKMKIIIISLRISFLIIILEGKMIM